MYLGRCIWAGVSRLVSLGFRRRADGARLVDQPSLKRHGPADFGSARRVWIEHRGDVGSSLGLQRLRLAFVETPTRLGIVESPGTVGIGVVFDLLLKALQLGIKVIDLPESNSF